jgi:dTDP-4-dehydro-6-deoxy-alpha-D-glucopyranose 2,3-dehydratase
MIGEMAGPPLTRLREDTALPHRIARSAAALHGRTSHVDEVRDWLDRRRREIHFGVERIPFDALDGWSFDESTGNLGHRSGRFFTVEGLHVSVGDAPSAEWYQPIICQMEVGILGILAKEFDGVLHFLMQAKMEPGNPNLLQLSPTVQATRSNYTKVHQGAAVRYVEHFTRTARGRVLSDVLQSEHGSWFYRKRNRNMIVEVSGDVPAHDDFRWLTLGQIGELLRQDNVVNMDSRSVLAGLPGDGAPRALYSNTDLLSWIASMRSANTVRAERIPLASVPGWARGPWSIDHERERYFRVVAVSVRAGNREVAQWSQPLFEPCGEGIVAFLTRHIDGVPHVLAHARLEGGFLDTVELGPTVQCIPGSHAHLPAEDRPAFLDLVSAADPSRVRYSALHSEEGGRFLNAVSRYLVVEADESQAPLDQPPGFQWVSYGQLAALAQHSHYVNVQARTLLACLNTLSTRAPAG